MLPADYEERVYAGVLGKMIGVYLGRPFEGWTYQRIMAELGEVTGYVNHRTDVALKHHLLVVPDDDISGTLVFARALRDHGLTPTAADFGRVWLNYLIEDKAVLWWGGLGNSTEHTAYLRLQAGLVPPETGSIRCNGQVVAEQVGAQIFVEGLAMTTPGDPVAAADLALTSASVSHDGEALHAARVVAALVAQAFVETDVDALLDVATTVIPPDCLIRTVIDDVRRWAAEDDDWHRTRKLIDQRYGYHRYGGNCHVIPNHAVVIAALAHSGGDFRRAMTVVTTSGWDTDSNGGNVGAVMGVLVGLPGLERHVDDGANWRGPLADRLYLPSADCGSAVTDAVREATALSAMGRRRAGDPVPAAAKGGARFHFGLPGSVQGFVADDVRTTTVQNVLADGRRQLEVTHRPDPDRPTAEPALVTTSTFIPPEAAGPQIYRLVASPAISPGQELRAQVSVPAGGPAVTCSLVLRHYDGDDQLASTCGPPRTLRPGEDALLTWRVPDLGGQPVASVGVQLQPTEPSPSRLLVDWLDWAGEPDVVLTRPADGGSMWRRAWVDAVDRFDDRWPEPFRPVQNRGTGMLLHGSRDWRDYRVSADLTPHLASSVGLAARVQGMTRHYSVRLTDSGLLQLIRTVDTPTVLDTRVVPWGLGRSYHLALAVAGQELTVWLDDQHVLTYTDQDSTLDCGGIALLVADGRCATTEVRVTPHPRSVHLEGTQS